MSFDPFNNPQVPPDDRGPFANQPNPAQPTPARLGGDYQQQQPGHQSPSGPNVGDIRGRVIFPAVLMMLSSLLGLLIGGYLILNLVVLASLPPEKLREELKKNPMIKQQDLDNLEKQGQTLESIIGMVKIGYGIMAGCNIVSALLGLFAGIRMIQLRSYGLVIFSAILTIIPLLSGGACCCIGEVAGLWTLILLLQEDVRAAFR